MAGRKRYPVFADMKGRDEKVLDLGVTINDIKTGIEVKSPFRERPDTEWSGGESDKIVSAIEQADKQFDDSTPNLLVVVPELRVPIRWHREYLLHACFGSSVYRGEFDPSAGRARNFKFEFDPAGKFFRTTRPDGKVMKADGFPAHRRISALLCIEEFVEHMCPMPDYRAFAIPDLPVDIRDALLDQHWRYHRPDNQTWIDHAVMVVHNPYALHPLSQASWNEFPQFVFDTDGVGQWTDGEPANI